MKTNNKGNIAAVVPVPRPVPRPSKKGNAPSILSGDEGQSDFQLGTAAEAERAGQVLFPVGGAYPLRDRFPAGRATGKALHLPTNRGCEITLIPFVEIPGSRDDVTGRRDLWGSREWSIRSLIQHDNLEPLRDYGRCEVHRCHYAVSDAPNAVPLSRLPLPVPVPVAMSVLVGIVQALAALHAGGEGGRAVVHGGVGLDSIRLVSEPARRVLLCGFETMTYANEPRPDGTGPAQPADDIRALGAVMEQLLFSAPVPAGTRAPVRASLARLQRVLTAMRAPEGANPPAAEQVLAQLVPSAG